MYLFCDFKKKQLEQQYTQKLQQSGSQQSLHQQRLDEMDMTVQKTISRSKRLEEERHNFHSRLIETDKEVGILKVSSLALDHIILGC